jgi:hypothetical protein
MTRPLRLLLLAWCFCAPLCAAEVIPSLDERNVNLRIEALEFPANLSKELTSGLTNRVLARISLLDGATLLQQRNVAIAIRYDLWDQTFAFNTDVDGKVQARTFADPSQLNAFLAALEIPGVFMSSQLPPGRELRISAELLLNPIGREKLGMIRKWVAENSTPQAGGDAAAAGNSELFNRIFEQYADGSQFAASWRVVVSSRTFRLNSLPHERR